jgi:thiamine-monophosphate kinase
MPGARARRPSPHLDEFAFIDRLRAGVGALPADVIAGIGDDAAVVRSSSRGQWVFTTDLLAEGVHFSLSTTTLEDLGFKAGAANLSDIAAMGAFPRFLLVDVAIPSSLSPRDLLQFYRGLSALCRQHRVVLIGGDTSGSRAGLFIAVTAIGRTDRQAVLRRGAKPGDCLFVSGTVGDSLAGLALLGRPMRKTRRSARLSAFHRETLLRRHRRPSPQVALGYALGRRRLATAMIDLSDGLSGDLSHLCRHSRVGVLVEAAALPISGALLSYAEGTGRSPVDLALQGGEDYELLFTVDPRHRQAVLALGRLLNVRLTEIGRMMPASFGRRLQTVSGRHRTLPVTSYRHFHISSRRGS